MKTTKARITPAQLARKGYHRCGQQSGFTAYARDLASGAMRFVYLHPTRPAHFMTA